MKRSLQRMLVAGWAAVLPRIAEAHHAMGGATPGNAFEGFVSGLAHPIIGLDHFLFVLAVGAACYYFGRRMGTVFAFIGGTLGGTIVHLYGATLPYPDLWVALSLVLLGLMFFSAHGFLRSRGAAAFFALSGLLHGYAYGESIVGAEPTPLVAYLIGFALVQLAVAFGAYALARAMKRRKPAFQAWAALGGALSLVGAGFLFLSLS